MTMVIDTAPKKRRRVDQQSATPQSAKHPSSRYPQSCLLSSLLYRQAPRHLAASAHSVVVTTPPKPNPPGIHAITGDHYTLDLDGKHAPLCKTQLRMAQELHDRRTITHSEWNRRGTALATVDETGRIGIWELGSSAEEWTQIYTVDLCQPVAAFLWLNDDRRYGYSEADDRFVREKIQGPRNPYGVLSFVVVTVQGQLAVYYQRGGKIFSVYSTTLPTVGGTGYRRADTGCYGMMLMGLDEWKRISHASIMLGKDGHVYLAAHYANTQSQTVHIYKVTIRFTYGSREAGGVLCQEIAKLTLTRSLLKDAGLSSSTGRPVSQVHLLQRKSKIMLVVGLSASQDNGQFTSLLAKWTLEEKGQNDAPSARASLNYTEGFSIPQTFITCLSSSRDGRLVVGLSNGSVHMEFRESTEFGLAKTASDADISISSSFWQVLAPSSYSNGRPDAVVDVALSPNETHTLCLYSSGKYGVARTTSIQEAGQANAEIALLEKMIKLSLLNQVEDADLLSELVRLEAATGNKGIAEEVISRAMTAYQVYCNQGRSDSVAVTPLQADLDAAASTLHEWNSPQRGYAYGLALGLLDRLPDRTIQYNNFTRAIQLPVILECFLGSCTSDFSSVNQVLENSDKTDISLEFDPDSLWSLISLTTWTLDFVRWILCKWFMLFNCKHPKSSHLADITARPVHAVLLLHRPSRTALFKTLIIIKHFIQFTSSSSYELHHRPDTADLLHKYASNILHNEPVTIDDMLSFLKAIDGVDDHNNDNSENVEMKGGTGGGGGDSIAKEWMLLLQSRLPKSQLSQLEKITAEFVEKCAQPAIYLEQDKEQRIDVLRKRRIPPNAKHVRSCVRCHQLSLPPSIALDESDPSAYALWYRSLGRRCICGGLFT